MTRLAKFSADWAAVSALLDEALNLPASEHAAWLDGLAEERAVHREALRSLLQHRPAIETEAFLVDGPTLKLDGADAASTGLGEGTDVGAYRLIAEIGRGGMGTVWLAGRSDGSMKRRVALKLPRIVWGDTFAERLARERDILSTLEHEHIARLYDAGVDAQGRPFLAMEYVEGETIDAYCRSRALPLRSRIALLLQVMAAVAHAHSRLVVHRDLKPGNILVTRVGQVKLLDFGIAKLLEGESTRSTALTELSGRALTLDYASPEQVRGEPLGTASDVYSLGVVGYELLAGVRPYRLKRGSAGELEDAIASAEIPRPSAVASHLADRRLLRGDLDSILNKALKKTPAERYPTVDAFAQDIQRWSAGQPVTARPDRLSYRVAKFVGRYRLQVAAGAAVAVAMSAGTAIALWQAREARLQAGRAVSEAATAKAVQGFIESVFAANSGNQSDPNAARETTARELLDRGAERAERELAAQPEAQLRLYQTMQEMYAHMALNDRAIALQRRSAELATRLHGADSTAAVLQSLNLAKTLLETNQRDEARTLLLRASQIEQQRDPPDGRTSMVVDASLAALEFNDDPARALVSARRAAARALEQPPTQDTINALQMLGETANVTGHLEEAESALTQADAQIARNPLAGAGGLPLILGTLGEVQDKLGRPDAAAATLDRAMALARRISDPYTLHIVGFRLSRHQVENGLFREALETSAADAAWAKTAGPDFGVIPLVLVGQHARALVAFGDARRALATIDGLGERVLTLAPAQLGLLLAIRADALISLGRAAEGGADIDRAVGLVKDGTGAYDLVRAARRRWWVATGRFEPALQELRSEPASAAGRKSGIEALRRQAEEAGVLWAAGHAEEAQQAAADVLARLAQTPERRFARPAEAQAAEVVGRAATRAGSAAVALPTLERAVALRRELQDPGRSPELAAALSALAECLAALDDRRAAAAAEEARRIRAQAQSG